MYLTVPSWFLIGSGWGVGGGGQGSVRHNSTVVSWRSNPPLPRLWELWALGSPVGAPVGALVHETTYAHIIYTVLFVMFLRAYPLFGQVGGGWALELSTFWAPNGTHLTAWWHFTGPKKFCSGILCASSEALEHSLQLFLLIKERWLSKTVHCAVGNRFQICSSCLYQSLSDVEQKPQLELCAPLEIVFRTKRKRLLYTRVTASWRCWKLGGWNCFGQLARLF